MSVNNELPMKYKKLLLSTIRSDYKDIQLHNKDELINQVLQNNKILPICQDIDNAIIIEFLDTYLYQDKDKFCFNPERKKKSGKVIIIKDPYSEKQIVEPVLERVIEPVLQPAIEPVLEPVIEPVLEPVIEPVLEPVLEPIPEPIPELKKELTEAEEIAELEKEFNDLRDNSMKEKKVQYITGDKEFDDLENEFNNFLNGNEQCAEENDNEEIPEFPKENYISIKRTDPIYGPFGSQAIQDVQEDDIYDAETLNVETKVEKLLAIEYPAQRSQGWFDMRNNKITASDTGTVLGNNKYEKQYNFILKKICDVPFTGKKACYHGKKYEQIATSIYEYRMNVRVEEFGLIGHPVHKFLGASPDGIVGKYKADGIHRTKLIGRMVEIKCPVTRKIITSGEIKDNICPIYYWTQVQQHSSCC